MANGRVSPVNCLSRPFGGQLVFENVEHLCLYMYNFYAVSSILPLIFGIQNYKRLNVCSDSYQTAPEPFLIQ